MGATTITTNPITAYTERSTSVANYIAVSRAIPGRLVDKARLHIEMLHSSGDIEVRVVSQTSDDGISWNSPTTITNYTTFTSTDGWTYGTTFETISGANYVRFGLEARNKTSTTVDAARCRLVLELTFTG